MSLCVVMVCVMPMGRGIHVCVHVCIWAGELVTVCVSMGTGVWVTVRVSSRV